MKKINCEERIDITKNGLFKRIIYEIAGGGRHDGSFGYDMDINDKYVLSAFGLAGRFDAIYDSLLQFSKFV